MPSIYTLGCIAIFALMGWWSGQDWGTGREGAAVLGGVVGWALGSAFAPKSKRKSESPGRQDE